MNKIFTLILPVDNMMKPSVQNSQQRYVGNARNFLVSFSCSLYEHASSADVNFFFQLIVSRSSC